MKASTEEVWGGEGGVQAGGKGEEARSHEWMRRGREGLGGGAQDKVRLLRSREVTKGSSPREQEAAREDL